MLWRSARRNHAERGARNTRSDTGSGRSGAELPGAGNALKFADEGALRVASRLHAFNRYELKYLVPVEQAAEIRDELSERMDRDLHSPVGGYGVWSLYYDTPQLRFYWEKIEGLKFRRKLRIRHYGDLREVTPDSEVCVEIKQRVNRVTQKRRIMVPYVQALRLCDERQMIDCSPGERKFVEEVLELIIRLNLQPAAMTGYQREALVGRGSDTGLRVTFDRRVRGRDRDFRFDQISPDDVSNRFTVPPHLSVMEVKINERTPYWITDLAARRNLNLVRISKYVQSIEAYGLAPRSVFHVNEGDHPAPLRDVDYSSTAHDPFYISPDALTKGRAEARIP